jgi:5-methylcytosine-specific restriction endonuclease McrA
MLPRAARVRTPRERILYDTRIFVWNRDGGQCRHCGSTKNLQFDHVIAASMGGSNTAENVELLCGDCNARKGAKLVPPQQ